MRFSFVLLGAPQSNDLCIVMGARMLVGRTMLRSMYSKLGELFLEDSIVDTIFRANLTLEVSV